jgi:hypothetical protein
VARQADPAGRYLRWTAPLVVAAGVLIFIAGVVINSDGTGVVGLLLVLAGLVQMLSVYLLFGPVISRRIRSRVHRTGNQKLTFTEDGVHSATSLSEGLMRWTSFSKAGQRDGVYFIASARSNNSFLLVPQRAFASSEDEDAFRRVVAAHTKAAF